jgi:WD40 repeat protein
MPVSRKLRFILVILAPISQPVCLAAAPPRTDRQGDPLPARALARLGSLRFRAPGGVAALGFSADGKTLLTAGNDHILRGLDLASGKEVHRFRYTEPYVSFAPDGRSVGLMDKEGRFRLVESATGKELARLRLLHPADQGWVKAPFLISPDGKTLVTSSIQPGFTGLGDGFLHFIDLSTGKKRFEVGDRSGRGPQAQILRAGGVLSPDGRILASAAVWRSEVVLWDTATGSKLAELKTPGYVSDLAFSADGRSVASGHHQGKDLFLWETVTGRERTRLRHPLAPNESVRWVTFSPRGRLLAAASSEGRVFVWDLAGNKILHSFASDPIRSGDRSAGPMFSPDGRMLVIPRGNAIQLRDTASGKLLPQSADSHLHGVAGLAVSPDGKTAITRGKNTVRFWDVRSGKEKRSLNEPTLKMALTRDGKHLATLGAKYYSGRINGVDGFYVRGTVYLGPLKVWDVRGNADPREIPLRPSCRGVVFSPDGSTVAIASWFNKVQLRDVATGRQLHEWKENERGDLTFAPDGTFLFDARPYLRSALLRPGRKAEFFAGDCESWAVAIAPDGKSLGAWGKDGAFHVYDVATGKSQSRFQPAPSKIRPLFYLPDGKAILFQGDQEVLCWEVSPPRQRWRIKGTVEALTYLPAFDVLAGAVADAVVLWKTADGKEVARLVGHQDRVNCLAVQGGGRLLLSGSTDGTALVWDVARALGR